MTVKSVANLADLTPLLQLKTVRVYEISARRRDGFDTEESPADLNASEMHLQQDLTGNEFSFRAQLEMCTEKAIIKVDAAAIFEVAEPIGDLEESVLTEFAYNVGLPITLPYLRVHTQQAARQIGVPAPLIRHYWPGELRQLELRSPRRESSDNLEDPAPHSM